jgi:hypothetical protein
MMMSLPEIEFRHPIKDLARIEVAKDSPFEFEKQRRMEGLGEIEENVGPLQPMPQFAPGEADTTHRLEIVHFCRVLGVEQAVTPAQSMGAELPLKIYNAGLVTGGVARPREPLEPNSVLSQPA